MDEAKNQINDLEHNKGKNNQSEQQEEKKNPKNKDSISSLWANFKMSNIHMIRVPEGKEKEQEIGNLFEQIMKENFHNLAQEIDRQVQEAESPKQEECKEAHTKTHHNYNAKD